MLNNKFIPRTQDSLGGENAKILIAKASIAVEDLAVDRNTSVFYVALLCR